MTRDTATSGLVSLDKERAVPPLHSGSSRRPPAGSTTGGSNSQRPVRSGRPNINGVQRGGGSPWNRHLRSSGTTMSAAYLRPAEMLPWQRLPLRQHLRSPSRPIRARTASSPDQPGSSMPTGGSWARSWSALLKRGSARGTTSSWIRKRQGTTRLFFCFLLPSFPRQSVSL